VGRRGHPPPEQEGHPPSTLGRAPHGGHGRQAGGRFCHDSGGKTTVAAYLMDATGATRSNVRTWLRNDRLMPRIGRPAFLTEAEEATIARAMEL